MSDTYYPPGAFYFTVTVLGSGTLFSLLTDIDASFQEVSGINAEFGIEPVTEGGENRFIHKLPKATKYQNLVLKRGVVTQDSVLAEWVGQTVGSGMSLPILPQNLLVSLLNESGNPIIVWGFANAYPVKWDVSPMNSQENKILTETMEFAYNYFERVNLGSGLSAAVKIAQLAARLA
ncbi:MAG: phage tail protein [Polyangiaceae bacterium]|nr:phage tail protein [Polyangiaceae bacterium]